MTITVHGEVAQVTQDGGAEQTKGQGQDNGLLTALRPLVIEIGIPTWTYYLLHGALGVGLIPALALSSLPPAVRTVVTAVRDRKFNGLAGLMLLVNVVGILSSLVSGDARLMFAKDGAISSVVGASILFSVFAGRPLMTTGIKPILTKGDPSKIAAWDRLIVGSARFRTLEKAFSAVWGVALLGECVARVILAYTLPISTMVWLSGVMVVGAIVVAMFAGGPASGGMEKLIEAEVKRQDV